VHLVITRQARGPSSSLHGGSSRLGRAATRVPSSRHGTWRCLPLLRRHQLPHIRHWQQLISKDIKLSSHGSHGSSTLLPAQPSACCLLRGLGGHRRAHAQAGAEQLLQVWAAGLQVRGQAGQRAAAWRGLPLVVALVGLAGGVVSGRCLAYYLPGASDWPTRDAGAICGGGGHNMLTV
jgi:hypothetical protein